MKRYAIWDKMSPIITPIGEFLSPEQWIERYPAAGIESITVVCSAGEINGGIFATLGQMIQNAEAAGCDFSDCVTDLEKLQRIEDFEDEMNTPVENLEPTPEERTAAALEFMAMASMPDMEV